MTKVSNKFMMEEDATTLELTKSARNLTCTHTHTPYHIYNIGSSQESHFSSTLPQPDPPAIMQVFIEHTHYILKFN